MNGLRDRSPPEPGPQAGMFRTAKANFVVDLVARVVVEKLLELLAPVTLQGDPGRLVGRKVGQGHHRPRRGSGLPDLAALEREDQMGVDPGQTVLRGHVVSFEPLVQLHGQAIGSRRPPVSPGGSCRSGAHNPWPSAPLSSSGIMVALYLAMEPARSWPRIGSMTMPYSAMIRVTGHSSVAQSRAR